uniref:DUF1618 domain-containing protein n=1 Tax=Oryza glaberrima TaxID=4538 RepID=I1Q8H8_ORYGL
MTPPVCFAPGSRSEAAAATASRRRERWRSKAAASAGRICRPSWRSSSPRGGGGGSSTDYVRFRAVCSPWRAAAPSPRGRGVLDPLLHPGARWMMFPEGFGRFPGHRALAGHAHFLDLSASAAAALIRVPLPLLRDHCVLDSPDGLLLLQRDGDTAIRLLHPFTGDIAEFPPPRFPRPPAPPPGLRPHRRSDVHLHRLDVQHLRYPILTPDPQDLRRRRCRR